MDDIIKWTFEEGDPNKRYIYKVKVLTRQSLRQNKNSVAPGMLIQESRFLNFQVKRQIYNAKAAFAIFISDSTKKILGRIKTMQDREEKQSAQ